MPLDPASSLPLHAQIRDLIQMQIARGQFQPGARLPTVRQLAVDLRVNSNTVARVYADLERLGIVTTRRGGGTFVSESAPQATLPVRERRLESLCRDFAVRCSEEGFSLTEVRRAMRALSSPPQEEP